MLFCTAWSPDSIGESKHWNTRYRRWIEAVKASQVVYDKVLIVDDGSVSLPGWPDVTVVNEGAEDAGSRLITLYHFNRHLGRNAITDFPGWARSFQFAAQYAERYGFNKVIHIESDAFLISERVQSYINQFDNGWLAFWCPRWQRPESGIQVIAGEQMATYINLAKQDINILAKSIVEESLPFTHVERSYVGDRYGEYESSIPKNADYSAQTFPGVWTSHKDYFWWMDGVIEEVTGSFQKAAVKYSTTPRKAAVHSGISYLTFFETVFKVLRPRTYFEIGGKAGDSLAKFPCDSICVDPNLQLNAGVIGCRTRTFLFQMESDEFFKKEGIRKFFPHGADIGFLDGLHLFEFLLRDLANFERSSHVKSIAILHDCLPTNERMAERKFRPGGLDELAHERDFWTGDVWKVLPAIKKYRPDLRVFFLDCAPTGLVIVTNLDSGGESFLDNYQKIVGDFMSMQLADYTFERLWNLFPTLSSAELIKHDGDLGAVFGL